MFFEVPQGPKIFFFKGPGPKIFFLRALGPSQKEDRQSPCGGGGRACPCSI